MCFFFVPYMFDNYYVVIGVIYLLLALFPVCIQFFSIYPVLLTELTLTTSTALLRDSQTEKDAIRAQKLQKILRLMMAMTKIVVAEKKAKGKDLEGQEGPGYDLSNPKTQAEFNEVSRIFDKFDTAGRGEVQVSQLKLMLEAFGMSLSEEGLQDLFVILDQDHSGTISRRIVAMEAFKQSR